MNIGINISPLKKAETITGINNYILKIVSKLEFYDKENQYYLFTNDVLQVHIDEKPNIHIIQCRSIGTKKILWGRYLLGLQVSKYNLDIFWSPIHHLPLIRQGHTRYFITIHDLADFKLKHTAPEDFSLLGIWKKIYLKHIIKSSCKSADGVIAVSQATKNDIVELLHIDPGKISVIYEGGIEEDSESVQFSADQVLKIMQRYRIHKPYLLYVGTLQPRKNIATIVEAFLLLKENHSCNTQLVLAGGVGWGMNDVLKRIENSAVKSDIILTGYVSEDEKKALYQNADAFVFPSLYEGFGIPILEAFYYGLPVITARNSALPEVGGDAAFYLNDEKSSVELERMMKKVLSLSNEEIRIVKNKEKIQIAKFEWGGGTLSLQNLWFGR